MYALPPPFASKRWRRGRVGDRNGAAGQHGREAKPGARSSLFPRLPQHFTTMSSITKRTYSQRAASHPVKVARSVSFHAGLISARPLAPG